MFPGRYFAPSYFASRYWAKFGSGVTVVVEPDIITMVGRIRRIATATARFARTITLTVER